MMLLASFSVFYAANAFRLAGRASGARVTTRSLLEDTADLEPTLGDLEPEPQFEDASLPDFEMPDFDDIARVRWRMLETAGCAQVLAKDACKKAFAASGPAKPGIVKEEWQNKDLGVKLAAFNKYAHKNANTSWSLTSKTKADASMDFDEFSEMLCAGVKANGAWDKKPVQGTAYQAPEAAFKDVKVVTAWIKEQFKYGHFSGAEKMAKDFMKTSRLKEARKKRKEQDIQDLADFATLDIDQNGALDIKEVEPYLPSEFPAGEKIVPYDWKIVAHLDKSDFGVLKIPTSLTENVLMMSSAKDSVTKAEYESTDSRALHLQSRLAHFIRLSKIPLPPYTKPAEIQALLKFHQIAEAFPITAPSARIPRQLKQNIDGVEETLTIPTIPEIFNIPNRIELCDNTPIKRWLKQDAQGMSNSKIGKVFNNRVFGGAKWQNATDMANEVLAWGDGVVPGSRGKVRKGRQGNGCLQGPKAGKDDDEWREVAPRLILFVTLDHNADGKLTFQESAPYLEPHDAELFEDPVWVYEDGKPPDAWPDEAGEHVQPRPLSRSLSESGPVRDVVSSHSLSEPLHRSEPVVVSPKSKSMSSEDLTPTPTGFKPSGAKSMHLPDNGDLDSGASGGRLHASANF